MSEMAQWLETIETGIYGRDVRAAIHDSIEQITEGQSSYTALSRTLGGALKGWTISEIIETAGEESTLLEDPSYFSIPFNRFDPEKDGLVIWRVRNLTEWRPFVINSLNYNLELDLDNGATKINFVHSTTFQAGDEAYFVIYKRPPYVESQNVYSIVGLYEDAFNDIEVRDPNTLYCIKSSGSSAGG